VAGFAAARGIVLTWLGLALTLNGGAKPISSPPPRSRIGLTDSDGRVARRRRAAGLLLSYLRGDGAPPWPGADGLTVKGVFCADSQVASAGHCPP
jgi:hypothetical protein